MKDLRPLGSEKLTGDEKIKRILEIANYGRTPKPSVNVDKPEYITESKSGGVYGIVKEKDGFYVKKGLNESSLEYIGGMFMKNKNRFTSYGEAFKRLDYLKGQESLQEATKYILKQTKTPEVKPMEAAPAEPSMSELPPMDAPAPEGEMPPSGNVPPTGAEGEPSPEGGEQLRSSYMANIQKFAGKLGQELRDQKDKLESDDLKYTLNMVISAVNLDQLDDKDFEEIADKFDPEKREGGKEGDIPTVDDMPPVGDEASPEEIAEYKRIDQDSEKIKDTYFPSGVYAQGKSSSLYDDEDEYDNEKGEDFSDYFDDPEKISDYNYDEELDETMASLEEFINTPVEDEEDSTSSLLRQYSDLDGNEEEVTEKFSSMDLPMERTEEITPKGKVYFNDKENRYEFNSKSFKDSYEQHYKYVFYIVEIKGQKYLHSYKLIDRNDDGNFTMEMGGSSSPLNNLPDWINKHFSYEIEILKSYSEDEIDENFYSGEDDDHDEVKHGMNSIKNYMDKMDQDKNVDWEEKLRNKSSQKPPLDIDEISRAITQALSKYR